MTEATLSTDTSARTGGRILIDQLLRQNVERTEDFVPAFERALAPVWSA